MVTSPSPFRPAGHRPRWRGSSVSGSWRHWARAGAGSCAQRVPNAKNASLGARTGNTRVEGSHRRSLPMTSANASNGRGLLLVGHGSHLNGDSSAPVYEHAERLRAGGDWAEVRTGFWKEEPQLSRALDGCHVSDVTVVPVFISAG